MRSAKTTVYDQNNKLQWYFISLRCKKVQSPAKQFKELFSLCPITFDEMESSFARFNHFVFNFGIESPG